MIQRLNTILIEVDKSSYLFELISNNDQEYIQVTQTIFSTQEQVKSSLTLKMKTVPIFIESLQELAKNYAERFPLKTETNKIDQPNLNRTQNVIKYYLKGVEIEDIAKFFRLNVEKVKKILVNEGYEIVSNKVPNNLGKKPWYKYKRKK
ncbi:MAG: hypothetical protein WAU01_10335 [Saprospiraceae bacterium]